MRKKEKQDLSNFIDLLEQAHAQIVACVFRDEKNNVNQLLIDCQEGAISIGTMVEESEGEGNNFVHILEQYCESLYMIGQEVDSTADKAFLRKKSTQYDKMFQKYVENLRVSLNNDVRTTKEIVFLPYNSSMWDSLESVYLKSLEEPDCESFVIPIPYFERDKDGKLGKMHYEGDKFPDNIKITNYEEYDFQNRHPDKIYIHNPYDASNYVTSVHPFFYSKNLKQYTDDLVYIPYFVLREIEPNDYASIAGMEHFIKVPAVIHANTVIVQSENMRQIYIDVMTKETGEESRPYWEEKIKGYGSPKFDKVRRIREEGIKLPEEWEKKLYRNDGTRKKVIFYNTSVVALLNYKETMIDKIESVIKQFEEMKDNVLLIWRPHPLMLSTIDTMRPELGDRYRKIVENYKKCEWGVYDEMPSMDYVLSICDAYYGDGSSVVWLCQNQKIPVMIQNPCIK